MSLTNGSDLSWFVHHSCLFHWAKNRTVTCIRETTVFYDYVMLSGTMQLFIRLVALEVLPYYGAWTAQKLISILEHFFTNCFIQGIFPVGGPIKFNYNCTQVYARDKFDDGHWYLRFTIRPIKQNPILFVGAKQTLYLPSTKMILPDGTSDLWLHTLSTRENVLDPN